MEPVCSRESYRKPLFSSFFSSSDWFCQCFHRDIVCTGSRGVFSRLQQCNSFLFLLSVVPFGKNNIYTMPCDITFWGKPENEKEVILRMRRHGYMLRTFREPIPPKSGLTNPGDSATVMGIGRPPSIKISQDQVNCTTLFY